MTTITQEMKYRESLVKCTLAQGVARASRRYNKSRSYIYFWLKRYDGSITSLANYSRRPHHHPNQHRPEAIKLVRDMRKRNPLANHLCMRYNRHRYRAVSSAG